MKTRSKSQYLARDEAELERLGARLAAHTRPPTKVYLSGDLGSGKTTFCRGLLRALGHVGVVKSPTFSLQETYELGELGELTVLHLDLYRLTDAREMVGYGLLDCFDEKAIVLLEWPERGGDLIPPADIAVRLEFVDEGRKVIIESRGDA